MCARHTTVEKRPHLVHAHIPEALVDLLVVGVSVVRALLHQGGTALQGTSLQRGTGAGKAVDASVQAATAAVPSHMPGWQPVLAALSE
jgi:hypothetical protein